MRIIISINSPPTELERMAENIVIGWKREYSLYYEANHTLVWMGLTRELCGYNHIMLSNSMGVGSKISGYRWLTSAGNLYAIGLEANCLTVAYHGRRHGLRQKAFVALLRDLWNEAKIIGKGKAHYDTTKPSWLPWETREDHHDDDHEEFLEVS